MNRQHWKSILRLAVFFVLLPLLAAGQDSDEFEEPVLIGKTPVSIPVAIAPPTVAGSFANAEQIATTAVRILAYDLSLSRNMHGPNFRVRDKGPRIRGQAQQDVSAGKTDYAAWREIGAYYVLWPTIQGSGDQVRLTIKVDDILAMRSLQTLTAGPVATLSFRSAVHGLSDTLVENLAQRQGIAQTRLAYVLKKGNTKEINLVDYDFHPSSRFSVTNYGSITMSPAWSPDARNLAYVSFRRGWADIYLHRLYAPAGARLSELARFKGNNITPTWNPSNLDELAVSLSWTGSPEIYLMKPDIKPRVTKRITNTPGIDTSPSFSPDAKMMTWTSDRSGNRPQIYIKDLAGGDERRLSNVSGMSCDLSAWSPVNIGSTPLIAFYAYRGREGHIFTVRPDGSDLKQITKGPGNYSHPAWSPDGMYLAYSSDRSGKSRIYVCSYDGTPPPGLKQHLEFNDPEGDALSPAWSPK